MSKQAGVLFIMCYLKTTTRTDTSAGQTVGLALAQFLRAPECVRHARVALARRLLSVWSVRLYEHVSVIRACLGFTWIYWYYTQRSFGELMTDQRFHSAFVLWGRTLAWITIKDSFILSVIYFLLQLFGSSSIVLWLNQGYFCQLNLKPWSKYFCHLKQNKC